MRIPSKKQCYHLIYDMKMLDHIVAHSIQVCRVATLIVKLLDDVSEVDINRNLVKASALLHDITKTRSLDTGENHASTGARLLTELGYPEVGNIIGQHVRLEQYFVSNYPIEAEIVNYADKRVLHDQLVPLSERMNYILDRYGKIPAHRESIRSIWKKTELLERKLFNYLPFSPEKLNSFLVPESCTEYLLDYHNVCDQLTTNIRNDSLSNIPD